MIFREVMLSAVAVVIALFSIAAVSDGAGKDTSKEAKMINEGSSVSVHYKLTIEGDVLDSSEGREPLEFKVGQGQVIPGFEKAVMGMKEGEKKAFEVSPEDGYGAEDPQGFRDIPRDQLPPDITPEVGMTLYASGPNGQSIPLRVSEVKEDVIVVNLNHPLAGKTLNFEIEIVDIK